MDVFEPYAESELSKSLIDRAVIVLKVPSTTCPQHLLNLTLMEPVGLTLRLRNKDRIVIIF